MTATIDDVRTIEMLRDALQRTQWALSQTQAALAEARRAARTDPLTGLGNREALRVVLAAFAVGTEAFGVVLVDLDRFKPINDTYGHAAGDQILVTVAARLRGLAPVGGATVRLGGDEFALLAPSPSPQMSHLLALDVAGALAEPVLVCGELITVGASIGVVHAWPSEADRAMSAADWAMYRAKSSGGGVVEHDPLLAPAAVEPRPGLRLRDLRRHQRVMAEGVLAA